MIQFTPPPLLSTHKYKTNPIRDTNEHIEIAQPAAAFETVLVSRHTILQNEAKLDRPKLQNEPHPKPERALRNRPARGRL